MVEGARLESVYTGNCIASSNLAVSAKNAFRAAIDSSGGFFTYTPPPPLIKIFPSKIGLDEYFRTLVITSITELSLKFKAMTKKILFLSVMTCFVTVLYAQKNKSTKAYAITTVQKGQSNWKEIRQVDIKTGEATQDVYLNGQDIEILNARTGKPVQKKDNLATKQQNNRVQVFTINEDNQAKLISNDEDLKKAKESGTKIVVIKKSGEFYGQQPYDNPFATNSAALAYDKKHDRLYYTPMGINQLRYIDLKSKTPKIYYFENEEFGNVKNTGDVANQITRMVIASDGNGYALPNEANHLIRFTTGKKPKITDLGAITDEAGSKLSIHKGVGGDIVADNSGNLYLITAYKNVFKIDIDKMTSMWMGKLKGIPEGYQTNGAVVDDENKILVCSSISTDGYYHFDINTLQAEKVATTSEVFNSSDLANANILDKKEDEEKTKEEVIEEPVVKDEAKEESKIANQLGETQVNNNNALIVYPNPVTDGIAKVSFNNQPMGRYDLQVLDMAGKVILNQYITISNKNQVQEIKLPESMGKGAYFVKVVSEDSKINLATKLTVQ